MAGVFFAFSVAVIPGLRRTDDRTFVRAFQAIDRAITNPVFLSIFLGALVAGGAAVLLHLPSQVRDVLPWVVAGFVLLAGVRARFDERRWLRWSHARTVLSAAAFGAFAWALVAHGQLG